VIGDGRADWRGFAYEAPSPRRRPATPMVIVLNDQRGLSISRPNVGAPSPATSSACRLKPAASTRPVSTTEDAAHPSCTRHRRSPSNGLGPEVKAAIEKAYWHPASSSRMSLEPRIHGLVSTGTTRHGSPQCPEPRAPGGRPGRWGLSTSTRSRGKGFRAPPERGRLRGMGDK